ncbi:radical SAM enzyme, Cfr family [Dehalogenimonas lykanthroporepellens BL-DC-9]|nr:radical SAM enzyme, Cfr family [Dehalogenimonas lykanthroporepellens BL-DC-9]
MDKPETTRTLLGMNTAELRQLAETLGQSAFRGNQLAEWLYHRDAAAIAEMTNLPAAFRYRLAECYPTGRPVVITRRQSDDGTLKLLLEFADGEQVETVGLPYHDRYSCCVSTQAGCPVGCAFCATGQGGYRRQLSAGEIVAQVLAVSREAGRRVDHVTFMGMGEPLLNYDATVKALHLLRDEVGIAARHLTVSTIGHVPGILRLARENLPVTLALSLHTPDEVTRRRLIPGLRSTPAEIVTAGREHFALTGRRLTVEYCLLDGVNDRPEDASALAVLLEGTGFHINLIPFNPTDDLPFRPSPATTVERFMNRLRAAGFEVTARVRRGADIEAACGQLRPRR